MGNDMSTLDNRVGANRGMPQTYSFSVSETLQRVRAAREELWMVGSAARSSVAEVAHVVAAVLVARVASSSEGWRFSRSMKCV